jgi:3-oxoadipate enol-lactonase
MSWATNAGNEIYWDEQGSGEPVLLAMGHGWDARMWWPLVPPLAERYRVIRFDNRGIGRTRWDGKPFLIDDLAADAFAVLDAAGVDRAHIYGVSMGGVTVQEMALSRPERVASLVLGCTRWNEASKGSILEPIQALVPFRSLMKLAPKMLYGPDADPAAIAEDLRLMLDANTPRKGRLAQTHAINAFSSKDRVSQITAPTLVIHGAHDRAVPIDKGRELAAAIPGAELCELPNSGHAYFGDKDPTQRDVLLDFLSRHPLS